MRHAVVACALSALAACSATPPAPIAAPPAAAAPTPPPSAAPPKLSLVVDERAPSLPAAVPVPAPQPLGRVFERVPLPPDAPQIVAIDGRSEQDVWLLAGGGQAVTLFHWDGARVTKHKGPACKQSPAYDTLVLTPDAMIAVGLYADITEGNWLQARTQARGGWSCEPGDQGQFLQVDAGLFHYVSGRRLTLAGRRIPLLSLELGYAVAELAARSPDELWLYRPRGNDVVYGNGVHWERRAPGLADVHSLRVDETGAAWLVGSEKSAEHGNVVLRWDNAAHAWTRLPAPEDLRGQRIRVASGRDVWILGREFVHHWDGNAFRRGGTPLDRMAGAWISAAGELWLVGHDSTQKQPNGAPVGVAFRAPVAPGNKP